MLSVVYTHFITHTGSSLEHMHSPLLSQKAVLNKCLKYEGFNTLLKGIAQEIPLE